jgi:hypothetical protein
MIICGRCGSANAIDDMRCVECKDYLHQYRSKSVTSNPARVALILAIVAIESAFLPFIEISGIFERRLADSPDGLAVFGAGLVVLIAVAIDGVSEAPSYAKPASLFAGLLLIATVAFDIQGLKARTSELLQSVNVLTAASLPKFAKLTVMDLIGSGP